MLKTYNRRNRLHIGLFLTHDLSNKFIYTVQSNMMKEFVEWTINLKLKAVFQFGDRSEL